MGLLFGVATADHQCEAYEARWEDMWDRWERDRSLTQRGHATDFWRRYPEDVELARGLGCTAFRLSIAWARVEPSPGVFGAAAWWARRFPTASSATPSRSSVRWAQACGGG